MRAFVRGMWLVRSVRSTRTPILAGALVFALVGSVVGNGMSVATAAGGDVSMADFAFRAPAITVAAGDTVTWTNDDVAVHDVTGDGGFASGIMAPGASFSYTFDTAGTFTYRCSLHPAMTGTVIVN